MLQFLGEEISNQSAKKRLQDEALGSNTKSNTVHKNPRLCDRQELLNPQPESFQIQDVDPSDTLLL